MLFLGTAASVFSIAATLRSAGDSSQRLLGLYEGVRSTFGDQPRPAKQPC